jgi:chloride channel protein, CIC family
VTDNSKADDAEPVSLRKDTLRDFTTDHRLLVLTGMALLIGAMGTLAAWALLRLIAVITNLAYFGRLSDQTVYLSQAHLAPWTIAIPVAGGLVIGLMARYGSEKIRGHGIPEAIEAILVGKSRIDPKVALLKPLSSALSIGTGGPFGAEGPIIMTAGALGSLFAQFFHLSNAERKTLLVAGAAAGMTGVFGTPVAAVLLAVELLLFEWKPRSFVPVAAAALVAQTVRPFLIGTGVLFPFAAVPAMPWWGLALCAVVGIVAGLQSALMTICLYGVEDLYRRLPFHWMWWPALGGLFVGIGGYFDPAVLGVGYDNIRGLLDNAMTAHSVWALLVGKTGVWIAALSSGTSGGVLAPLLMVGGALGALESHLLPFGGPAFWALIGMAAILGGTMRAPLTGTLFAVELTGNTHLLVPLLVASVAAFAVTVLLMRRSILTERVARRGHHITREYAIDPFLHTRVEQIMTRNVDTLPGSLPVGDAVAFFSGPEDALLHKSYPVVDAERRVIGVVSRSDALRWTREGWTAGMTLAGFAAQQNLFIGYAEELVGHLADRMAAADVGRVPILERGTDRLVGLVARRDLLQVRAQGIYDEMERQRLLHLPGLQEGRTISSSR